MPAARKPAAKAAPVEVEAVEVSPEEAATIAPAEVEGEAVEVGPDGVPTIGESPEPGVPGESAGFDDPDTGFRDAAQPESSEDVTVVLAVAIGGTRDGVPWPAIGGTITLPAAEAADYIRLGYAEAVDAE